MFEVQKLSLSARLYKQNGVDRKLVKMLNLVVNVFILRDTYMDFPLALGRSGHQIAS